MFLRKAQSFIIIDFEKITLRLYSDNPYVRNSYVIRLKIQMFDHSNYFATLCEWRKRKPT